MKALAEIYDKELFYIGSFTDLFLCRESIFKEAGRQAEKRPPRGVRCPHCSRPGTIDMFEDYFAGENASHQQTTMSTNTVAVTSRRSRGYFGPGIFPRL